MLKHTALILAAALTVGAAAAAHAEDEVARGDTVLTRPRTDYDPLGVRLGGFLLFPDLSLQESYDSNIFATESDAKSSFITSIEPSATLRSNWNNHALNLHADSRIVRYAEHSGEDFNDYTASADGRLDIYHDARLFGATGYRIRHEPRSSPDNVNSTEPVEYEDLFANVAGEKEFDRLSTRLEGTFDRYHYHDVVSSSGVFFNEGKRDRDEESVTLRAGYEFVPLRQVYVLGGYNWRNYDSTLDASGFDRNSTGYTVAVGAKYDLTGITFIDAFIGYRQQDYDDPRLSTISGPTAGAKLTWNVTRLTTITGNLTREVQETTLVGASGYFATTAQLRADHELLRNLLLNATLGYERDSFEGISRTDNYYDAGVGAKYLIDQNFYLSGGYSFRDRESSAPNSDFMDHIVFVRVSAHL